jgi:hypothetical protein
MAVIGKVAAVFSANTGGLTSGVNRAGRAMKQMAGDVRGLRSGLNLLTAIQGAQLFGSITGAALSAGRTLASFGASAAGGLMEAVNAAVDLGEETSKSSVIFGAAAGDIGKFAKSASALGISQVAALQATGTFGNLFRAIGLTSDQSADYAQTLTALSADLASFNNTSVDDAIVAVGAAIRGEAEPIRRYGVLLDDATLRQIALEEGLTNTTKNALSPAIKAQAAYAAILRQTTTAQGDFARTSGGIANLSRIIQAQGQNLLTSVGSSFVPVFQSAYAAVSQVLSSLEPFFVQFGEGLAGYLDRLASALTGLGPLFQSFVQGLDGRAAGEAVGAAIISSAQFFADVSDWVIAGLGNVFGNAASVGESWAVGWELGTRVGNLLYGAFKTFEMVGNIVGGLFSDIVAGLYNVAAGIAGLLPGFGETADQLSQSAAGWNATARQYAASMNANQDDAAAAFGRAFGDSAVASSDKAAGPIRQALDQSLANFRNAPRPGDAAGGAAAAAGATPPPAAAPGPSTEALKAIDSTSREGIVEMFRLMRGDGGTVQEEQLGVLEQIRDTLQSQPGDEWTEAAFAGT